MGSRTFNFLAAVQRESAWCVEAVRARARVGARLQVASTIARVTARVIASTIARVTARVIARVTGRAAAWVPPRIAARVT